MKKEEKVIIGISIGITIGIMIVGIISLPETPFGILKTAYALVCLLFIGSLFSLCARRVREGFIAMIIDTFRGRLKDKYLNEGLRFIWPWQKLDATSVSVHILEVKIKEIQTVIGAALEKVEGVVVWRPDLGNLFKYFEIGEKAAEKTITARFADFLAGIVGTMDVNECIRYYESLHKGLESELKNPPELSLKNHLSFTKKRLDEIRKRIDVLEGQIKAREKEGDEKKVKELQEEKNELLETQLRIEGYKKQKEDSFKNFIRSCLGVEKERNIEKHKQLRMKQNRVIRNINLFKEELKEILDPDFMSELDALINARKTNIETENITEVAPDRSELEEDYAIEIIGIDLFPIKLDEETAKERAKRTWNLFRRLAAQVDWRTTAELVRALKDKFPDIPDERALEFIYVNKGVIKRTIDTKEQKIDVPAVGEILDKTSEIIKVIKSK